MAQGDGPQSAAPPLRRPQFALDLQPWVVVLTGLVVAVAVPGPFSGTTVQRVVVGVEVVLVLVLLGRLAVAARSTPPRRRQLGAITGFLVLWLLGSAVLATGQPVHATVFPNVAEVFFVPAYVLLTAFLVLDVNGRANTTASWTAWLDTAVLCASGACLAGALLLSPLASQLDGDGPALLLAVVYPLVDLGLAALVVGQVLLGHRAVSVRTGVLVTALLGLAAADTIFLGTLAQGQTYSYDVLLVLGYAIVMILLVAVAVRPPQATTGARPRPGQLMPLLAVASLVALALLVVRPAGAGFWYVTGPAVITLLAVVARLVVALREAQSLVEARRLSETDDLTGLLNRRALMSELQRRHDEGEPVAMALLDLDAFKEINDSLGHPAGDQVLVETGARLKGLGPPVEVVARLGGDEFAVLLRPSAPLELLGSAAEVVGHVTRPMVVDGVDLGVRASVGLATAPAGGVRAEPAELVRRADVAMYRAKGSRASVVAWEPHHDVWTRDRLRLGEQLRHALDNGELVLDYQPQVDAVTGRVVAVEALVRWEHPDDGRLPPAVFLPTARSAGLMGRLTENVLAQALADLRTWLDAGLDLRVSVNCAPPELLGDAFVDHLLLGLRAAEVAPDRLVLEVTEDTFMHEPESARHRLVALHRAGVHLSIDDYGSGFSSLAYVRDLPIHQVKLDRAFISTVAVDATDRTIVDATARMAGALGLELVAEGVEDAESVHVLRELGVDVLQGYHVARPMTRDKVLGWASARVSGSGAVESLLGAVADRGERQGLAPVRRLRR